MSMSAAKAGPKLFSCLCGGPQAMEYMQNPNAMREMMRSQDLAMSQIENHPEGFNALRRMYEDVQVSKHGAS